MYEALLRRGYVSPEISKPFHKFDTVFRDDYSNDCLIPRPPKAPFGSRIYKIPRGSL